MKSFLMSAAAVVVAGTLLTAPAPTFAQTTEPGSGSPPAAGGPGSGEGPGAGPGYGPRGYGWGPA
ncbi:MAG: hypothetical protein ACM3IH_17230 [Sphingobacteriales bacterium]